jgi:hypothetical protein
MAFVLTKIVNSWAKQFLGIFLENKADFWEQGLKNGLIVALGNDEQF